MISVSSLTRIYKLGRVEVRALIDVSLSLEAGDITCVMGISNFFICCFHVVFHVVKN